MIPNLVSLRWELDDDRQQALLTLEVGIPGEPGSETFTIEVVTLSALGARVERDGIVVGRHLLIVESINQTRVELFVQDRLRRLAGETWSEVAAKVGRLGLREFEDYTPG